MIISCSRCNKPTNYWYTEEVYFRKTGIKLCPECFDRHIDRRDENGNHFCCQDFLDMNGKYAHYNLPVIPTAYQKMMDDELKKMGY